MQKHIVRSIVSNFASQSELGRLLDDTPVTTVNDWVRKNHMPKFRRLSVLRLVNERGIVLSPEQQAYLLNNYDANLKQNATPAKGVAHE